MKLKIDNKLWNIAEAEAEKRKAIAKKYGINLDAETQHGFTYSVYEDMTRRHEFTVDCKHCKTKHRKGTLVLTQADMDELWTGRAPDSAYAAFHGHRDYRDRYATPVDTFHRKDKKEVLTAKKG